MSKKNRPGSAATCGLAEYLDIIPQQLTDLNFKSKVEVLKLRTAVVDKYPQLIAGAAQARPGGSGQAVGYFGAGGLTGV